MDHCILLVKHLSNHMHFIKNGFKRFSKTNSTDPRQRVPLNTFNCPSIQYKATKTLTYTIQESVPRC